MNRASLPTTRQGAAALRPPPPVDHRAPGTGTPAPRGIPRPSRTTSVLGAVAVGCALAVVLFLFVVLVGRPEAGQGPFRNWRAMVQGHLQWLAGALGVAALALVLSLTADRLRRGRAR